MVFLVCCQGWVIRGKYRSCPYYHILIPNWLSGSSIEVKFHFRNGFLAEVLGVVKGLDLGVWYLLRSLFFCVLFRWDLNLELSSQAQILGQSSGSGIECDHDSQDGSRVGIQDQPMFECWFRCQDLVIDSVHSRLWCRPHDRCWCWVPVQKFGPAWGIALRS